MDTTQLRGCWCRRGGSLVLRALLGARSLPWTWRAHLSPVCCLYEEGLSASLALRALMARLRQCHHQCHHPGGGRDGIRSERDCGQCRASGSVVLRESLPNTSTVGSSQGLHQLLEAPRVSHEVSVRDTVLVILLKGILGIALSRLDCRELAVRGKGGVSNASQSLLCGTCRTEGTPGQRS